MKKLLYFGRDENDVIKIDAGGTAERTTSCDIVLRPLYLRCTIGGWPVVWDGPVAQAIMVTSLRLGRDEQLTRPVPLGVLVGPGPLALDTILPGWLVSIKLESNANKDPLELVLWLEGNEIDLVKQRAHAFVGDAIIGEDFTCGTRSPAEQIAHLEHELQKAHAQRDVAIEALKRLAGPDGEPIAWRKEIAKEALRQIHALRRPGAAKKGH